MVSDEAWNKIFRDYDIENHDFDSGPFGHSCISPWQYNHVIQRS